MMVCWIAAGYVTFSFFAQREPRFAMYWFPPMVYFAVGLLTEFFQKPKLRVAMRGLAARSWLWLHCQRGASSVLIFQATKTWPLDW